MSEISLEKDLILAKKKINEFSNLNKKTDIFLKNHYLLIKKLNARKHNLPIPLSDLKENVLILNENQSCNICGNASFFRINSNFICWNHLINYRKNI